MLIDAPCRCSQSAQMIDTLLGSALLLDFVPDQALPRSTLLELTGDRTKVRWSLFGRSGLQERVDIAWQKPVDQLSCGECRMLVGQRFGIKWLAAPVAAFVSRYPRAECDLYPGDLSVNALIAWYEIYENAPREAKQMIEADLDWIDDELVERPSDDLLIRARSSLHDARNRVRFEDDAEAG